MPEWNSWTAKLRDVADECTDDIVDELVAHVLASPPDVSATTATTEALNRARSDLSIRSAAAALVYVADDADDDAADLLDQAFVSRRNHPFLGPSLLLSLGMFALRNAYAHASILRHLLRLKLSDPRPLLVAGAKVCGLLCDREDSSVLRGRLVFLGGCDDPAVRAEGLYQFALLRFSDAMKAETHDALIVSLKAAVEAFQTVESSEDFRPDARLFILLIDATLEFEALEEDRAGAAERIGEIVAGLREMGRDRAGQLYAMNRSLSDSQLSDRCLAVAKSLQDAAKEIKESVRWTNFDTAVVSLAHCYGIISHAPRAYAGNEESVKAFSRLSERVFKPRLGPVLARKVGREGLTQVVENYEAVHGKDGATQGLLALQKAAVQAERAFGPRLSEEMVARLSFMAQRAGCEVDELVNDLSVLISANGGDGAAAERLLFSPARRAKKMPLPTVGVIVALDVEFDAMRLMLSNELPYRAPGSGGSREYSIGDVPSLRGGIHQVVLAQTMTMGNNAAALRAGKMLEHFDGLDCIIMCGIAGGIPHPQSPEDHVRLGDIVVTDRHGVIQYDLGKQKLEEFDHRHDPRPPSARLLEAVKILERNKLAGSRPWVEHLRAGLATRNYSRPNLSTDVVLDDDGKPVDHPPVAEPSPRVFLGQIASSNAVQGDFRKRDYLRDKFKVKAVEMEGSGVADAAWEFERVGYFDVRAICDYCDARTKPMQTDNWKPYAAMVAAAYVKSLLEVLPGG
jgi:nucleoside phosphorylase